MHVLDVFMSACNTLQILFVDILKPSHPFFYFTTIYGFVVIEPKSER